MLADIKKYLKTLGLSIKKSRKLQKISQETLAKNTGVSLRTISRIETGEDSSISNYVKILNYLGHDENLESLILKNNPRPSDYFNKQKQNSTKFIWGDDK